MTGCNIQIEVVGCSRTPFAIMSGGHTSNPEFSSTTGAHISLKRFTQLVFSTYNSTVEVGTGWVSYRSTILVTLLTICSRTLQTWPTYSQHLIRLATM